MSTNVDTNTENHANADRHPDLEHFKVNKTDVSTTAERLTGLEIKALAIAAHAAGVELTDLLELRKDGKKIPVTDTDSVEIEDGLIFRTYPGGKDS
ncbi:MAG: hypothetical protein ACYDB4_18100 [Candidatus Dormibacteraceae bacterium]